MMRQHLVAAVTVVAAGVACSRGVAVDPVPAPLNLGEPMPSASSTPRRQPQPDVTTPPHTVAHVATPATPPMPSCVASWFGEELRGATMANGEPFDPDLLVAASWYVPFGTVLRVTAVDTGRSVDVVVADRGPARSLGRCIDLSTAAFSRIADPAVGLVDVTVEEVGTDG